MKLTIALISILIISCTPPRLVPYDYSSEKNNREAYIELDSISIALESLEIKRKHYMFILSIENNSDQPLFVKLNQIQKYANDLSYREGVSYDGYREVTTAMTPEQVQGFFKEKEAEAEAAAFFLFLVGAAITTYDAIQDHKDNSKETWTEADEKKTMKREVATTATLLATDILTDVAAHNADEAATELRYLPGELFDREVIYPGESYHGKVFFRRVGPVKKFHRITFPVDDKRLHFDFRKPTLSEQSY